MKNIILIIFLSFCYYIITYAQTTIILQPDGAKGKDALLHGAPSYVNNNYGNNAQLPATTWTFSGEIGAVRSVVDFGLTFIPVNTVIISAQLTLYAWANTGGMGPHSTMSGLNNCWLERVTSSWDESTVTWDTQPSTTTQNRVSLPASTSATEDYLNINVTALVQDMVNNPASSFGFMLKLQNENYYRKMNFCSSDHTNLMLRPKLEVCYSSSISIDEQPISNNFMLIYPNPANNLVTIKINTNLLGSPYTVTDQLGRTMLTGKLILENSNININELSPGMYVLTIGEQNQKSFKLIKK